MEHFSDCNRAEVMLGRSAFPWCHELQLLAW